MGTTTEKAKKWFSDLIQSKSKFEYKKVGVPKFGHLHSFVYKAKYGDRIYDAFPISIPFGIESKTWIGLNLHWVRLSDRMALLKALDKNSKIVNEKKRMFVNASLINMISKSKRFKPAIHRYLHSHVRTQYSLIPIEKDFSNLIMLPPAKWKNGKPY